MTTARRLARAGAAPVGATGPGIPLLLLSRLHPGWSDAETVAKQLEPWLTKSDRNLLDSGWPPRILYSRALGRWGRARGYGAVAVWREMSRLRDENGGELFPRGPEALPRRTTNSTTKGTR